MNAVLASPVMKSWQAALDSQVESTANQRQAFADFLTRGLPTTKLDTWKYTDLRRLTMRQFRPAPARDDQAQAKELLLPLDDCHRLIFVDGQLSGAFSSQPVEGLSIVPLVVTQPSSDAAAFDLLNAALSTNAVRIKIADNRTLDRPIYIAFVWTQTAGALMTHPRVQLSLGSNATATFIEHHFGVNTEACFANTAIAVAINDRATLEHIRVQDDSIANFNIASIRATVGRGANYTSHQYILGGALARADINVELVGQEAQAELYGLVFADTTQHLDVRTCINHQVPNTRSSEDYRGIADHRGRVVFNGKVIVSKDAQRTDAKQSSRNLLLAPHAEIDTRPELEIYANDVKCAHGATVGQLDAVALFYLQSRGIAHSEARALLTRAFAAELIERSPVAAVREHVLARLMTRMRTQGGTL